NYNTLKGEDCSCFPWLKRAVGPGFFVGDAVMLGLAVLAGVWSKRSDNLRGATLILGAVTVFALVSYGVAATRSTGLKAPESMTDDEFFDFCQLYPDFRIERTAQGEIIIMPPTGLETGFRNNDLSLQLGNWAKADGRGKVFDSSTEFILPSGAARSPDASWI